MIFASALNLHVNNDRLVFIQLSIHKSRH